MPTTAAGTLELVHDAVDATTHLVGEAHDTVAGVVSRPLYAIPELDEPLRRIDATRHALTHGILGAIRWLNRTSERVLKATFDLDEPGSDPAPPHPLRSDVLHTVEGALDQVVGALNGIIGDHLAARNNGHDLGMCLRHDHSWLQPTPDGIREAIPHPTGKVVVLLHGVMTTELSWSFGADRTLGGAENHFGGMLRNDLDFTPIYVRYNTGRSVDDNGRRLAELLNALTAAWPVPLESLVMIGHSMGGLVARAATHAGASTHGPWLERLTHLVCIGSPQQGAPLARLGEFAADTLLALEHPATRIIGRILSHRSEGIRDLRHRDLPCLGPLLDHVRYLFVAGTLSKEGSHVGADFLGDLLVPVSSATGPARPNVYRARVGEILHHRLQTDPRVYRALHAVLSLPAR